MLPLNIYLKKLYYSVQLRILHGIYKICIKLYLTSLDEKRKYRNFLSITTMDSKIVYFKMSDDKKRKINYSNSLKYVSDIDKAAERIRYWLRQRRVDYQMTKNMDK